MTTIDVTLDPPNPLTDSQTTFNSKALAFTQALNPWATQVNTVAGEVNADKVDAANSATAAANAATDAAEQKTLAQGFADDAAEQAALAVAAAGSAVNAPGTSATSATPRTVGTGPLTLTIQTGKAYAIGQFVVVASTASPENYMAGQITAHNASVGALTVNVTRVGGSGSFSDWTVSVVGAPAASATSGAATQELSANLTLTSTSARYQTVSTTAENLSILLPAATGLSVGSELFSIENIGMYPIPVRDSAERLQAIVQPGQIALVYLKDNSTAAGAWAVGTTRGVVAGGILAHTATAAATGTTASYAAVVGLSETNALLVSRSSTSEFKAYVLTVSGTSITVGAANTFAVAANAADSMMLARVSDTQAFIVLGDSVNVLTVSGDTVTRGTGAATTLGGVSQSAICQLSDTTLVLLGGLSATLYVLVLTLSGTTVSAGSQASLTVSSSNGPIKACALTNRKLLVCMEASRFYVVNINGTTASLGSEAPITSSSLSPGSAIGLEALSPTSALLVGVASSKTAASIISIRPSANGSASILVIEKVFQFGEYVSAPAIFSSKTLIFTCMGRDTFVVSAADDSQDMSPFMVLRVTGDDIKVFAHKILTQSIPRQNFARLSGKKGILITSTAATTPFARVMEVA